jgi:purine-binding chemotaxis protein CheW
MNTATTQTREISSILDAGGSNQCLTFKLADEEYGVDIMKVQEIRSWEPATNIPNTPDFIVGVINLRGNVVPVIDLRKRFSLDKAEYGASTVIVVVKVEHQGDERTMGLVVDAVSEVYNISEEMMRETPELGSAVNTEFVKGLATVDDKMIIMLDADLIVSPEHLNVEEQVA